MKNSIFSISILVSLLFFPLTLKAAPDVPPGKPFQGVVEVLSAKIDEVKQDVADLADKVMDLMDQVTDLQSDVSMLKDDMAMVKDDLSAVSDQVDQLANSLNVEVAVYTDGCASGSVQCNSDADDLHTFEAASSANQNPFPIRLVVTKNGIAVTDLTAANFSFSNKFVPAGGTSAVLCDTDCGGSWFQSNSGIYSLYIDRFTGNDLDNWDAGNYTSILVVTDNDGNKGTALVSFSLE